MHLPKDTCATAIGVLSPVKSLLFHSCALKCFKPKSSLSTVLFTANIQRNRSHVVDAVPDPESHGYCWGSNPGLNDCHPRVLPLGHACICRFCNFNYINYEQADCHRHQLVKTSKYTSPARHPSAHDGDCILLSQTHRTSSFQEEHALQDKS